MCDFSRSSPPAFTKSPLFYIRSILSLAFDKAARNRLLSMSQTFTTGMGYMRQQSTRPQTLGYGLSDSPVGLLGWIYEKLVAWTDKYPWADDEGTLSPVH